MLKQNSKMKKDGIFSFGMAPLVTCPMAGDCKKYCYACKGNYRRFPKISEGLHKSFLASLEDAFSQRMIVAITLKKNVNLVRIHTEGDFYDQKYLDKWIEIMKALPNKQFYCYTKSLHLNWEEALKLPNFKRIQSFGGKLDNSIDAKLPHAIIFDSVKACEDAGYVNCSESDLVAAAQGTVKVGLVRH